MLEEVIKMKIKNTISYGKSADRSMKTWMQLFRAYHKIRANETAYITSFRITSYNVCYTKLLRGLSIGQCRTYT